MNFRAASIADLVRSLTSPEDGMRNSAAKELYRRGQELAEEAISTWRQNSEIGALISVHATVGIAVTPQRFAAIRSALGNPHLADVPPEQDAQEFEWSVGEGMQLDILTTREPDGAGAIARFLAKFGEGIQQVEFPTPDVERATEMIRSRLGVAAIYPATRAGADGTRVNFFLASTAGGKKVLIELVETPKRAWNPRANIL
ncbi:MAG: VOC family protein [Candidatus Acidiferrales bacterium]